MDDKRHSPETSDVARVLSFLRPALSRKTLTITVVEQPGDPTIMHVEGDIDVTTESEFNTWLTDAASGEHDLILDLREVGFLACGDMTLLDTAALRLRYYDSCMAVVGARAVRRALHISGMYRSLPCYETVEAASNTLREA